MAMNISGKYNADTRTTRSRVFYTLMTVLGISVVTYLLIALQSLILPVVLGIVAAYICDPLLNVMYRNGIPRKGSIFILFGGFLVIIYLIVRSVIPLIPGESEQLQYRLSIQMNLNDRYQHYMGLEESLQEGNKLHDYVGFEIDPLMDTFNQWLYLTEPDQVKLREWSQTLDEESEARIRSLLDRMQDLRLYSRPGVPVSQRVSGMERNENFEENTGNTGSELLSVLNILSIWLVMPVMFLFSLIDRGRMKHGLVTLVPNTYFEMALTVMANVDRAIGNYLRGTLIETLLMAATIWVLLVLIGFDTGIGMILAVISGIANVIPIFGMFIGIAVCVIYVLSIDQVSAVLPFITVQNLILWTVVVHLVAQTIDNIVFKPFVLGKVVALHPIVVFLGAIVGSILFGFIGLLFAIPTIVIIKEVIGTIYFQLKAYYIIY